jgi:hypothetical protein
MPQKRFGTDPGQMQATYSNIRCPQATDKISLVRKISSAPAHRPGDGAHGPLRMSRDARYTAQQGPTVDYALVLIRDERRL